jgi:uncharacterized protein
MFDADPALRSPGELPSMPLRVAVVGSGISGLAVAHALSGRASVTLFEAADYFGGHAHTVDVTLEGHTHGVDTGFLVYNERTYPQLIRLLKRLQVDSAPSDMSFSVQVAGGPGSTALEWSGSSLSTVFAQRSNLLRWRFWNMLRDLLRFNGLATRLAVSDQDALLEQALGVFLDEHQFSREFREWYLLPMLGCIWSCPTDQMLQFPVSTLIRFCHNHGLLQVLRRPQWFTVRGGARNYVEKMVASIADKRLSTPVLNIERMQDSRGPAVAVRTPSGTEHFDHVVLATHADQSLALLRGPTAEEKSILGAIRYQPNRAVLHTDSSVLPSRRSAWAAWNYERAASTPDVQDPKVCLHYLLNRLQPLPFQQNVLVSLNPVRAIAPQHILGEFDYAHPVFDLAAARAQQSLPGLQGRHQVWYCGAWTGYGFHEDGLQSGLQIARQILVASEARALERV